MIARHWASACGLRVAVTSLAVAAIVLPFTLAWPSAALAGVTATSRVTTYSYDARSRYKTGETNPLSQGQTTKYDAVTGVVTSTTGPNNLTTNWPAQDAFGRPMRENRADGTYTTTERFRCGGFVTCPPFAILKLVTRSWDSDNRLAAPTQTVYQDKLFREVRRSTVSLSGSEVHVDTAYDAQGRMVKKSEPFFEGAQTIYWTTIQYDLLDRPILTTRPDGGSQSVFYNGLTETSTNELGQTKSVTKDAMGRERRGEGARLSTPRVGALFGPLPSRVLARSETWW